MHSFYLNLYFLSLYTNITNIFLVTFTLLPYMVNVGNLTLVYFVGLTKIYFNSDKQYSHLTDNPVVISRPLIFLR